MWYNKTGGKMDVQGNIIDIDKKRIYAGTVSIQHGKITSIVPLPQDIVCDGKDKLRPYILPGFIDAHVHLEMTHAIPSEYARAALSQGTIAAVVDCHDTVNVVGRRGVEAYIKSAKKIPFAFAFSAPSTLCKERYTIADVEKLLSRSEVTNLGEIQNFPDVLLNEKYIQQLIAVAKKHNKPIDGCSPGLSKDRLDQYLDSGISTDHQCTSYDNALEKIEHEMIVMLQTKKIDSLSQLFPLFTYHGSHLMFSGQNIYAPALSKGYINSAVSKAIAQGADMYGVLTAACLTPVKQYHLPIGTLHNDDNADFIIVDSVEKFNVLATFYHGKCVYSASKDYKANSFKVVKIHNLNNWNTKPILKEDLRISAASNAMGKSISCEMRPDVNVIDVCDGEVTTVRNMRFIQEKKGLLEADTKQDCIKVVVYSRYEKNAKPATAFVHGFGIKTGGAAMSISHDAHNIVAIGVEDEDIAKAINRVVSLKGGIALSVNGKICSDLAFPVCGLMSNLPLDELNKKFAQLYFDLNKKMGCILQHPIDTLSYIASPQLPSIKLTPEGLVNVVEQEIVPLVP